VICALAACRSNRGNQPVRQVIDPELTQLTKDQLFDRGEQQFARKKWAAARRYYSHVYETSPNDPLGRRALLRVADTYFAQGDPVNLVEAQYKYRDFINRYPGSDRADYAMLQIAMVSHKQMEKPDRDQQRTREAVEKFNDMLRAFPNSPLRPEAEKHLQEAVDRLATHEHIVARYYIKRHSYNAAVQRLNAMIDEYPNYRDRAGVFYLLGNALSGLGRTAEARLYYERVIAEFPQSEYAEQAKRRLGSLKPA
jgi:outer membrane protein assembly factor BamD